MTKSTATRCLRTMFPTARIIRIERAGVEGFQVETPLGVTYRTFDLSPDAYWRCVAFTLPLWQQRVGLA